MLQRRIGEAERQNVTSKCAPPGDDGGPQEGPGQGRQEAGTLLSEAESGGLDHARGPRLLISESVTFP